VPPSWQAEGDKAQVQYDPGSTIITQAQELQVGHRSSYSLHDLAIWYDLLHSHRPSSLGSRAMPALELAPSEAMFHPSGTCALQYAWALPSRTRIENDRLCLSRA
jgi:hypothetical protein